MDQAQARVQELVSQHEGDVAVAVLPLDGSQGFSVFGSKRFVSASMIKLLVLAEFMEGVDSGVRSLDSTYTRSDEDMIGGTGIIQNDAPGTVYAYDDLARYMIAYSDNTATNVLINSMGMSKINEKATKLGLNQTVLQRKMMDLNSGTENYISADNAATILKGIANHTIASEAMCERAESYLLAQTDFEGLAMGIPSSVQFGHKTGTLDSVRHDGGIVYAQKPYVIVALTENMSSSANSLIAQVSKSVYDSLE